MTAIVKLVFGALGWKFNDKCVLVPSRQVIYNGMWIDSDSFEIRATDAKIDAAWRLAWKLWKFESKRHAKEQACSEQTNGVNVRLCKSSFKEADQT